MTFLETTVDVPIWFPVLTVLVGAIVGLAIMILATWFGSRGHKTQVSSKADTVARAIQSSIVKQPAPVQISLSSEQRAGLESRAKIDGGYHVSDLVRMLGVPEKDILRWIKSKKLSLYTDSYRQTWVTAVSVLSLVDELTKTEMVETQPQRDSISEAKKPVVTARRPSPFRQHYWYTIDGNNGRFATLREVLQVAGCPLAEGANPDWKKIPTIVKRKIHREKV